MNTIFLAESEKHVLAALRLVLEHQGDFRIAGEASTIESTLAQVCQHPPDVILLDWNLPGIHPQRLIQTLREHCPATWIVASSVKPEHEMVAKGYRLDGFLSKQLPAEAFMTALDSILSERRWSA